MACFGRDHKKDPRTSIGRFQRSSPALQQILLLVCRAENRMLIDHHLYESGSVEYHIESSASDSHNIYLSIATPILTPKGLVSQGICPYMVQKVKDICPNVLNLVDPPRKGYQLTVRLNISQIPHGKGGTMIIKEIAAIKSVIWSSQLRQMLRNFSLEDASQGAYKLIKFIYHPKEPIFLIRQSHKLIVVFEMRFRESSDVIMATSFFQELNNVKNSEEWTKAPLCTWSTIPPMELRGEAIEDFNTDRVFVSFDIFSHHVDEKRLDNTVWNLMNFNPYVKSHIKSTKGFIQRNMRKKLEELAKILHQPNQNEDKNEQKVRGCGWPINPVSSTRLRRLGKQYTNFNHKINELDIGLKFLHLPK